MRLLFLVVHRATLLTRHRVAYMVIRTAAPFYFHYKNHTSPLFDITWSFPLRLMVWEVVFGASHLRASK